MNGRRIQIQQAVEKFLTFVKHVDGVLEVALFGSAASGKAIPQDFDLMVFIRDEKCITKISECIRKTTSIFHAHDVFIFNAHRQYLGRICECKRCPTLSVECKVKECGKIKYLKSWKD